MKLYIVKDQDEKLIDIFTSREEIEEKLFKYDSDFSWEMFEKTNWVLWCDESLREYVQELADEEGVDFYDKINSSGWESEWEETCLMYLDIEER